MNTKNTKLKSGELRWCSWHAYILIYAECLPQCKAMGLPLALLRVHNLLHT